MNSIGRACVVRTVGVICALICCVGASTWAQAAGKGQEKRPSAAPVVHALLISDIHFEPFWDPAKVTQLENIPATEWSKVLSAPPAADREARFDRLQETCHARGEDSSYRLYQSSLKAMQADASDTKFVVVSGDLISHDFTCKFNTLVPDAKPGAYQAFVKKTIEFVMAELHGAFQGVPVYAALGNNDSDCGDYRLDAGGKFLSTEAKEFTGGFVPADREQAARDFAAGGYYSVGLPPPMEHTRLLVLDDLFMSRRYATCGEKDDVSAAASQIAWLEKELSEARKNHEMVWVMAHIPPGVDPFSTARKGPALCMGAAPTMFLSSDALPEVLAKYGDVIRLAIFAHTHMDEVRWLAPPDDSAKQDGVAIKMVPSISPINGNNPAFTLATIDPETAVMKDYRVIAASNDTGLDTKWAEEYDFEDAYKEPDFSAATLQDLIGRFDSDRSAQTEASQSYIRNYDVGQPVRELGPLWPAYVCALKNETGAAFTSCLCGK